MRASEYANNITQYGALALIIVCFIYLTIMSILIRDLTFPKEHPFLFTAETLLFGLSGSLIILFIAYGRDSFYNKDTFIIFGSLFVKFCLFHILLQFSGFYSYVFNYKI